MSWLSTAAGWIAGGALSPILTGASAILQGVGASVNTILNKALPDANKVLDVAEKSAEAVARRDTALYTSMAQVMAADSASESWLTRNVRPIVVMWSLVNITVIECLAPTAYADKVISALGKIPDPLWNLCTYGIGIYAAGRSAEKI